MYYKENIVKTQLYSLITFLPLVLYNQFRFFFNLFYLLITLTQFYPPLKVGDLKSLLFVMFLGFLMTYLSPLVFVLSLTILKEAYDDLKRFKRDNEAN